MESLNLLCVDMNANELADELTKMFKGEEYDRLVHEIPDMLRQQQAEIEALKAGKIRAYDNGVEDGRKPNTNPVKEQLTDEEIKAVYGEYFDVENCDWLQLQCIQAILRKAQER